MVLQEIIDFPAIVGLHVKLAIATWVIFLGKYGRQERPIGGSQAPVERVSYPQSGTSKFANPFLFPPDQRQKAGAVNIGNVEPKGVEYSRHQVHGLSQGADSTSGMSSSRHANDQRNMDQF